MVFSSPHADSYRFRLRVLGCCSSFSGLDVLHCSGSYHAPFRFIPDYAFWFCAHTFRQFPLVQLFVCVIPVPLRALVTFVLSAFFVSHFLILHVINLIVVCC